jgi:uncharacterized protein
MKIPVAVAAVVLTLGTGLVWWTSNPDDCADLATLVEADPASVTSPCDQNNLGDIYYYGDGVTKDFVQAVTWFRLAADQGYPDAQHNLGEMYFNGEGISRDLEEAHFWLSLASAEWNTVSAAAGEFRDQVASFMTPEQIEHSLARIAAWKPSASP